MAMKISKQKIKEVVKELKKHKLEQDAVIGVFLLAQTDENLDIIMDYLSKHPQADQTEILQFANTLYEEPNE